MLCDGNNKEDSVECDIISLSAASCLIECIVPLLLYPSDSI